jgi:competence protein ComFC
MSLLDWLFPKYCLGCRRAGGYFCPQCRLKFQRATQICPVCATASLTGKTHPSCQDKYTLDGLTCLYAYNSMMKATIHKLKYELVFDLVDEFWQIARQELRGKNTPGIREFVKQKPLVIPVPLYWYKENNRGFNQASLLGKKLAVELKLPFVGKVLTRQKHTPTQTTLHPKERRSNVAGAFGVNSKLLPPNSKLLIIDDIWTTGATLKSCCLALKEAGAKKVWGLTIAR